MAILENLFGEFIDGLLNIQPEEAVELGAKYTLYNGHTIGYWLLIGAIGVVVIATTIGCIVSKKFRNRIF